ncbi:hypothetical protein F7725_017513, partial [Dissostichus mawsoni]
MISSYSVNNSTKVKNKRQSPRKVLSCRSLKAIPTDTRQRLYNWICQHPYQSVSKQQTCTGFGLRSFDSSILFECLLVEEKTRKQSRSRVWFEQRAGRVTASSFHEAAKTESSSSLIKRVCYPRSSQFPLKRP